MTGQPHYIAQIVPAPEGWVAQGSPLPGEEFWYESTDGAYTVFPDEWAGWVRQEVEGGATRIYPDPQSAFAGAGSEACTMIRASGLPCGAPAVVSRKSMGEINHFCADCAKWGL